MLACAHSYYVPQYIVNNIFTNPRPPIVDRSMLASEVIPSQDYIDGLILHYWYNFVKYS